jgi:hypothetical protein
MAHLLTRQPCRPCPICDRRPQPASAIRHPMAPRQPKRRERTEGQGKKNEQLKSHQALLVEAPVKSRRMSKPSSRSVFVYIRRLHRRRGIAVPRERRAASTWTTSSISAEGGDRGGPPSDNNLFNVIYFADQQRGAVEGVIVSLLPQGLYRRLLGNLIVYNVLHW